MRQLAISMLALAALVGCTKNENAGSTNTSSASSVTTTTTPTAVKTETPPTTTPAASKPVHTWKNVGLSTPESVFYDAQWDGYLVSNVEGKPLDADGKGFISRLSHDGTVATLKWIEGGKNKVTLNAPKGMAIFKDQLYVADIDTVRVFDAKTGAPAFDVKVPGATFLNDVAAADDRVLVSDTGTTGNDAIYAIMPDKKVASVAKAKDLNGPNGIAIAKGKTYVATYGNSEIFTLDPTGKKGDVQTLPKGKLDGLLVVNDELIVSSWDANAIFRGKPGGPMKAIIEDIKAPADLGYDSKRNRILVPLFEENEVRAYELK